MDILFYLKITFLPENHDALHFLYLMQGYSLVSLLTFAMFLSDLSMLVMLLEEMEIIVMQINNLLRHESAFHQFSFLHIKHITS
jgi:hypothetical protein